MLGRNMYYQRTEGLKTTPPREVLMQSPKYPRNQNKDQTNKHYSQHKYSWWFDAILWNHVLKVEDVTAYVNYDKGE